MDTNKRTAARKIAKFLGCAIDDQRHALAVVVGKEDMEHCHWVRSAELELIRRGFREKLAKALWIEVLAPTIACDDDVIWGAVADIAFAPIGARIGAMLTLIRNEEFPGLR